MKYALVIILAFTSFNLFASELHCTGQLLEIKAKIQPKTFKLLNVVIYEYSEGNVNKSKASSIKPWALTNGSQSYELPGRDRDANESWAIELPTSQLEKENATFIAKMNVRYCRGEDEIEMSCQIYQN